MTKRIAGAMCALALLVAPAAVPTTAAAGHVSPQFICWFWPYAPGCWPR